MVNDMLLGISAPLKSTPIRFNSISEPETLQECSEADCFECPHYPKNADYEIREQWFIYCPHRQHLKDLIK